MNSIIPYGRQSIDEDDIAAVTAVLRSDWLTQGPRIGHFEQAVANHCGAKHAVAVSSATAALHIACLALGLGPGDILWTSPNTFVASANCARYCGADVDFVDIDPATLNMSLPQLAQKLAEAKVKQRLPKVVVPVHFAGQPCEMAAIRQLADQYGFAVLEDASHAIGASYQGQPVGDCRHADMTVFSFHPVKIITSGEGGMVTTNRADLYQALCRLRSHGITRDPGQLQGEVDGDWCYQQLELGFNYRMTDLQAALGCQQMSKLNDFVARRRQLAAWYRAQLSGLPLRLQDSISDASSAWHLLVVMLDDPDWRKPVFQALRQAGILVNVHYQPVYLQPYYRQLGFAAGYCPAAENYYHRALTLPLYPALSDQDTQRVVDKLRNTLSEIVK